MVSGVAERNYPDVRVFNPYAPSNRHANLQLVYRKYEQIKKHAYEQRIREVEHATFSTLVVSATGDLARALHKQYHYSVSDKGRNICQFVFSETAAFGSYGMKHEGKRQLLMRTGLPRVGPLARCILKAQEVTAKGVYRLLHAIYYCS